ncbi:hypothetical protein D3C80_1896870 [compost metagenome]
MEVETIAGISLVFTRFAWLVMTLRNMFTWFMALSVYVLNCILFLKLEVEGGGPGCALAFIVCTFKESTKEWTLL